MSTFSLDKFVSFCCRTAAAAAVCAGLFRAEQSAAHGRLILISSKSIRYPTTQSNTLNGFFGEVVDGHTEAVGNLQSVRHLIDISDEIVIFLSYALYPELITISNHCCQSAALAAAGIDADNALHWQRQPFSGRQQFCRFSVAFEPGWKVKGDMSDHSQSTIVLILQNNIVIMDQSIRVIRLDRIGLYPGVYSLEMFITPEKQAFVLQERPGIPNFSQTVFIL